MNYDTDSLLKVRLLLNIVKSDVTFLRLQLIQFLVSLVGSSHGVPGRKRGLPMLSDVSDTQIATKMPRYGSSLSIEVRNQQPPPYTVQLVRNIGSLRRILKLSFPNFLCNLNTDFLFVCFITCKRCLPFECVH